ncbi:MAG: hypothetical protein ABRQ37_06610 [Candidatus Eremiobacterota bacterium]
MSTAAFLLAPHTLPPGKDRFNYLKWEKKISRIVSYRGGYSEKRKGNRLFYICNRGDVNEFSFGEFCGDELERFMKIPSFYPGDYIVLWTYGHAVHVMAVKSFEKGSPVIKELNLRLTVPSGLKRREGLFDSFKEFFQESSICPDFKALYKEYTGKEISVKSWFASFGIEGAKNFEGKDKKELWKIFEETVTSLLQGKEVSVKSIKKLNEEISCMDDRAKIRTKPAKKTGETGRLISFAGYALSEILGRPDSLQWKERYRAASFYRDITDCEAITQLTTGKDKKGTGLSASFGRLLCHYPVHLYRDNIFWVIAGRETESANGHAYVESMYSFSEFCHKAGFLLVIYPWELQKKFRKTFGIEPYEEISPLKNMETAELFIDTPLLKADMSEEAKKWFLKEDSTGMTVRGEADGTYRITCFKDGNIIPCEGRETNEELLKKASKELNIREVFSSLGLPYLIEPGKWEEGAYRGHSSCGTERETCMKFLENLPKEKIINHPAEILKDFPDMIKGDRIISIVITYPFFDEDYMRTLLKDLKGKGLVENYGEVWVENNSLIFFSRTSVMTSLFIRIIGDVPEGTKMAVYNGRSFHYELKYTEKPDLLPGQHFNEEKKEDISLRYWNGIDIDDEKVTGLVLEGKGRYYFSVETFKYDEENEEIINEKVKDFESLGLKYLGNVVCTDFSNIVMRAYVYPKENVLATLYVSIFGNTEAEFFTFFEDGTGITTTTAVRYDRSDTKIFTMTLPSASSIKELWEKHMEKVNKLKTDGLITVKTGESLIEFTEIIEKRFNENL